MIRNFLIFRCIFEWVFRGFRRSTNSKRSFTSWHCPYQVRNFLFTFFVYFFCLHFLFTFCVYIFCILFLSTFLFTILYLHFVFTFFVYIFSYRPLHMDKLQALLKSNHALQFSVKYDVDRDRWEICLKNLGLVFSYKWWIGCLKA